MRFKRRDEWDVRAFGALGDGVSDDSGAIQAAENAASSKFGGVVRFSLGNYLCASPIHKSPRTRWEGPGQRFVASATPSRRSQGARLVLGHDGNLLEVRGASGGGIKQRGGLFGIQLAGDPVAYPNSCGIDFADNVQEFWLHDVLVNGFQYGTQVDNCKNIRWYECYLSGATHTGIYCTNSTDLQLWHTQTSAEGTGGQYGANFVNCQSIHGEGNRFQVSEVANLRLENCTFVNLTGGFNDSGGPSCHGMIIVGGTRIRVTDTIYYSNHATDAHVVLEKPLNQPLSGVIITGTFARGSNDTPTAIKFVDGGGTGTFGNIAIGGEFAQMTSAVAGSAPSSYNVIPGSIGLDGRQMRPMDFRDAVSLRTYLDFPAEQASDPPAPATNGARLFTRDDGSSKTQLCIRFASGAVQVIATEP
jgi:hypothetical protein